MNSFKRLNLIFGWLTFLIAAVTYLLTIEPSTSLWDCGEFIATAFKLEVGHPPGAPLFMILARFFALFTSDVTKVAMMINSMSGLASAFTILFLFWTITHLAKKILLKDDQSYSSGNVIAVIGAGLVGSLAYTFSDTFWFSAVEGEVYATSSLFTAIVFWAILKWENEADNKFANRWLILIAYMVGLSIGVHLLNLLAIPAIVLVYYFKKYNVTSRGTIIAFIISGLILAFLMWGIIPGMVKTASRFELLFVNVFGLPYKTGVFVYALLLISSLIYGIYLTHKLEKNHLLISIVFSAAFFFIGAPMVSSSILLALLITGVVFIVIYYFAANQHAILNTILLVFTVIFIGYSSFSMIVIRSLANPPMDENNPENVFSLLSYLNREQYGDRPLMFGQYYNAPVDDVIQGKPMYIQDKGKYVISNYKTDYSYDDRFMTIFPRMYSSKAEHIEVYKKYGNISGRPVKITDSQGTKTVQKPTFGENIRFFISYQIGHMYIRYFMWNFVGRQNDIQADGGITEGNWLSGIDFIDEMFLGSQDNLPSSIKDHKARNTYYFLPLLLGLFGMFWHFNRHKKDAWVVMLLFVLTGLAIVIYLNQTPMQPRERDYAYAGSFYAFAIWIGLGVLSIYERLNKYIGKVPGATIIVAATLILVPGVMAKENWDDHDRSGRYFARDLAYNYLNSCAPNSILFTNGDNDTFPLWFAQEVEGIRTDVRVCNLMLFNTDWYIEQMARKAYESDPLPFSMTRDKWVQGTRDVVYVMERIDQYVPIKQVVEFISNDDDKTKVTTQGGEKIDYIPTRKFVMNVDKEKVIAAGVVKPEDRDLIVDKIEWTFKGRYLTKADMMVLDILAHNDWVRPIYFVSLGHSGTLGLEDYMQLEGFAYRLVPIKTDRNSILDYGRIDPEIMYENMMEKFMWGRMNAEDVYLDHFHVRTLSVVRLRHNFARLANALRESGDSARAEMVLDKCVDLTPNEKVPYDFFMTSVVEEYLKLGLKDKATVLIGEFFEITDENLSYFMSLEPKWRKGADQSTRMNLQLMQEINSLANQYDIKEYSEQINEKFSQYYMMFTTQQ